MKKISTFLFAVLLCSAGILPAQVSFNKANAALALGNAYSGVAIAVADMNADGFDDIVHLNQGRILTIQYQKPDGSGFTTMEVGSVSGQSQWSMCVADVDNNGFNDVLTGGRYDGVKLFQANVEGSSYAMGMLPGSGIFIQGSNFADINNDGWLDVFACHDDAAGRIWGNDGSGALQESNNWIDLATVPASDNSGNYGSVWSDIDNDGDLDLYIAKCRQGVNDPSDPRRINALYINDGAGNYTEAAAAANLKIGAQSWTADFGDIDNDGDMDCFITNHDVPSMLLINDGTGVFTDITTTSGVDISGLPIQGIFRDFDNDGWLDIIVSGTQDHIFKNNGNSTFTEVGGLFDNDQIESFAIGDLNHDGRLDIYAGYAQIYTTPSDIPDAVWLNTSTNDNHFLSVSLIGTTSNRNGVGARITIYGAWGQQVREVRSGESYGIMNSFSQHFGLGSTTTIDSIVVKWPSGQVDTYDELPGDQFLTLIEGTCISPNITLSADGPLTFCSGENVTLSAPEGFFAYTWSNGSTENTIEVTAAGIYSVAVNEGNGCFANSLPVVVTVDPDETPSISAAGDTLFCAGGSVTLVSTEAAGYTWSTGATTPSISVTETGDYSVTTQGLCATFPSSILHIEVLAAPVPEVFPDTVIVSGDAVLRATGDNPQWYDAPLGGNLLAEGDSLLVPSLSETTTFYVEDSELYPGPLYFSGISEHAGNTNYSGSQFNGQTIFDAYTPFTLKSVKVYTDTPGARTIELVNSNGTVLQALDVQIDSGTHVIPIFFQIPVANDLVLTTNTAKNMAVLGTTSPRLRRTNGPVNYPYVVPNVLNIKGSNLGTDVYYYFYNWEVKLRDIECTSERVPVEAVLFVPNSTGETALEGRLSIYPNPGNGEVFVSLPELSGSASLRVFDLNGASLLKQTVSPGQSQATIQAQELPAGVYAVKVEDAGKIWVGRLVVAR
jgi:hypothetical protein